MSKLTVLIKIVLRTRQLMALCQYISANCEIIVEKESASPNEDKCVHDAKLLILTLKSSLLSLINPKVFLEDAVFNSFLLYSQLLMGIEGIINTSLRHTHLSIPDQD